MFWLSSGDFREVKNVQSRLLTYKPAPRTAAKYNATATKSQVPSFEFEFEPAPGALSIVEFKDPVSVILSRTRVRYQ